MSNTGDRPLLHRKDQRIRIFIGEAEEWQGKPLYQAILELVRQHGAMGATVVRGIEGFGPKRHLSTERLPDISDNLPLIVEIIATAEKAEGLLLLLDPVVQKGMMTIAPIEIIHGGKVQ